MSRRLVINAAHCSKCGHQSQRGRCACQGYHSSQDLLPDLTVNSNLDAPTGGRVKYVGDCLPLPVMNYDKAEGSNADARGGGFGRREGEDDDEDDYPETENRRRMGLNARRGGYHQDPDLLLDEPTVNYAEWSAENRRANGGHGKPINNRQ